MPQNNPNSENDTYLIDIYPTEILRSRSNEYEEDEFGPELLALGEKMLRTMYEAEGIGLAANQIGLLKRIVVVDVTEDRSQQFILVNPVITRKEGEETMEEGCLSVPGIRGEVTRAEKITCEYYTPLGEHKVIDADGLLAVCIQHEIDHINGVMFFDYFPKFQRDQALAKLRKYMKKCKNKR